MGQRGQGSIQHQLRRGDCILNTRPYTADKCSSCPSPKMLFFVADRDQYRKTQVVKMQTATSRGESNPMTDTSTVQLYTENPRKFTEEQTEFKSQRTRISASRQCLLFKVGSHPRISNNMFA